MSHLLDGRALAARIRQKVKERIADAKLDLGLGVILVGDDPASHVYVNLKRKACEEAGIRFDLKIYPSDVPEEALIEQINIWNASEMITGILVQLPLPTQNPDRIIAAINPKKDVDGFHRTNVEALKAGKPALAPAVAIGIMKLIDAAKPEGREAVIVGSNLFAEPLIALMREQGISARAVSPSAWLRASKTKRADILVSAVGNPHFITPSDVKPGAVVIDVGTTKVGDRVQGDVHPAVSDVAGALSPVPGGVGPMTVACLLMNIMKARSLQTSK